MNSNLKCMTKYLKKWSVWPILLGAIFMTPIYANAPSQNPLDPPISLQFVDIEVVELLKVLAKLGSTNF